MPGIKLYTIGFTRKSAETFFTKIRNAGIKRVFDIRLNNVSQLAGFAKRNDLIFFLSKLCDCDYRHIPLMAPTNDILDAYKKKRIDWSEYVTRFNTLIKDRQIEKAVTPEELHEACLLCTEPAPEKCHRRLVAEYLKDKFDHVEINHL